MDNETSQHILDAVDRRFDEQTDFISEISSHDSTRGNEQGAQRFLDQQLRERGYSTDLWEINVDDIAAMPSMISPLCPGFRR
jgi:acetylornithine deacetylase